MELAGLTAHEARTLLDGGEVTSVELTTAVLERISQVEDRVKAFVTVTDELAMRQAEQADTRIAAGDVQPLTGVPMVLKDNMVTRGVRTTCSSRMLENFHSPLQRYGYRAGCMSKGQCLWARGISTSLRWDRRTRIPRFTPRTTRGHWTACRAGAAGDLLLQWRRTSACLRWDRIPAGSIRQPASLCGIVGMKPTYGLVSRFGLVAFASSLDQIGPLTKDVRDCAITLNAIAGNDPNDSTSLSVDMPDYTQALVEDLSGLRIGVPVEYFGEGLEAGVEGAVREAIDVMRSLGAEVEETSLPSTRHALAVYYIIAPSEASANLARYDGVKYGFSAQDADSVWDALEKTRQFGFGPEVKRRIMLGTYALSAGYYDAYYVQAQRVRTLIRREFEQVFTRFDAVVMPTSPTVAFKLGGEDG